MKSFKQFISEQDLHELSAKKAAQMIANDCSFYLSEIRFRCDEDKTRALFRGIGSWHPGEPMMQKHTASNNRSPLSTPMNIHHILDYFFDDNFGFRFRSRGTFAVGNPRTAADYGQANLIFPIGKFKYAWSKEIEDAYIYFASEFPEGRHDIIDYAENRGMEFSQSDLNDVPTSQAWVDAIEMYLHDHPDLYQDNELHTAASGQYKTHEVMLSCSEYYTIPYAYPPASPAAKDSQLQLFVEEMLEELRGMT